MAAHTRGVRRAGRRAERIQEAARGWAAFWEGRLDLDALAWETTELLGDLEEAEARVVRAEGEATRRWESLWGDDVLLRSVPGMGPLTAPTVRAFLAEGRQFPTAKEAQAFVGLNWRRLSRSSIQPQQRTALTAFAEADLTDLLPRIAVPTLLLYGERDVRATREVWEPLHSRTPNSKLVVIPEIGHHGQYRSG